MKNIAIFGASRAGKSTLVRMICEKYPNFIEIRKYEEEKDWTYHKTEEYVRKHCKFWTMKSREWKEKCEQLDIWYIDTSFHRKDILKDTMCKLEKLIL